MSNMVPIIALARALILDWLRSKTGVFFTFLFPIMLMSILTVVFDGSKGLDLYIQNLDVGTDGKPTELSLTLIDLLESSKALKIKHVAFEVDVYEYAKHSGKRILIIPQGFDASVRAKSIEARMIVMLSTLDLFLGQSSMQDDAISSMVSGREGLQRVLDTLRSSSDTGSMARLLLIVDSSRDREYEHVHGILASALTRFQQRAMDAPDTLEMDVVDINQVKQARTTNYYLPAVLAAFIMTNGVLGTSEIAAEFKRRGMLKRLMSTPLSRLQWIVANMLTQTLLALILASIMVCIAAVAFNTSLPNAMSIVVLAMGALCFTGLGMLITGTLKEPHAVTGASNAIVFPMMFLSGTFWPVESMPEYMQGIAYALPLTYFVDALNTSMYSSSMLDTLRSISILAVLTGAFILMGSYLTRWKQE